MIQPESPLAVLERSRRAAIEQSIEDIRRLYAPDAVHEFPFAFPGMPSRLVGREQIVNWIAGLWQDNPLRYQRYRTIAVHRTEDPDTIVVEQEAIGTSPVTGDFVLPNLQVLTARDGQILRLRDYVNIAAAAAALGSHDGVMVTDDNAADRVPGRRAAGTRIRETGPRARSVNEVPTAQALSRRPGLGQRRADGGVDAR